MKTSNILIDNQGNLKLADFGLARDFERDNKEREYTNMVVTRWYRPPELFMGAVKYDESVDMWGVGCVFGELLKRRPILTGQSDIDQLEKIFMLCGTPTMADWPEHINLPAYKSTISAIKSSYSKSFSERFSSLHKEEANLLELFLEMNPLKRISAKKALEHEYFITYPLPAQPGSKDFSPFPTSHEYQTRQERHKAEAEAEAKRASTTRNDGNWRGKDRREYDGRWKDERDSRDANRYNKRDNRYEHNRYSSNSRGSATECLTYPSKKKLH
ncbi:serine/threonine protein kinase, CMGC, CDC2/CDK sub [Lobulomyces angularis]|nr:serine/threonine protein kinase, CMGC, CDC2/CDK sub [Lobulomyces angularis]